VAHLLYSLFLGKRRTPESLFARMEKKGKVQDSEKRTEKKTTATPGFHVER